MTTKESSINQTANNITLQVKEVNTKTTQAQTAASTASDKASSATTSATNAAGSAETSGSKATAAASSAAAAAKSASSAANILTEVTTKKSSIDQTASNITLQVSDVTTKTATATTAATNAANSASTAGTKATAAASSASSAATSATNASASASSAAASLQSVTTKESHINQTASNITLQVSEVTTKTAQATNAAELATAMSKGKMLYRDPTFSSGLNSIYTYNNYGNGTVVLSRASGTSGNPNGSGYCLKITTTGSATPGLGGFTFLTQARANAIFITRFIANIPVGYTVEWASNSVGNGGGRTWLTSQAGAGTWTEYVCRVNCGSSGSFSSTNFFYITGGTVPLTWYVAYATVFDTTDVDDTPSRDEIKAGISITSGGISMFGQTLSFAGKVTFSSLDSDSQGRITTAQSTASSAVSAASTAQSTANTANSTANTALSNAKTANSGLSTLKGSLGGLAYENAVSLAKLDSTIVEGGYIKTSLINADAIITTSLLATKIAATDISTIKLTVNDGARIGDLYIYSGGLCTSSQGLILAATPFLYLNKNSLIVNSTNLQPSYSYIKRTEISAGQISIKCATTGTWNVTNPGLQIEVSGNSDNTAINILAGYISGFRLRILTVRTSQTLSVSDGIIISEADSEITLTLPSNPGNGKMYFIRKNGGGRIWVNASYIINDGDWYRERSTSVQLNKGCFAIFMYNGTYWTYNTVNG